MIISRMARKDRGKVADSGFSLKMGPQRRHFRAAGCVTKILARIEGEVDPERVRQALPKLKKRHPLLASRILVDKDGEAWYTDEGVPEFELNAYDKKDDLDWLVRVSEQDLVPFRMDAGPLARFILLTSESSSDLVLYVHHVVSDGLSVFYAMEDLLSFVGEPEAVLAPVPHPVEVEKNLPQKVNLSWFERLLIRRTNTAWRRSRVTFDENDFVRLQEKRYEERDRALFLELNPNETSALARKCHEIGVTLNSALLTALYATKHAMPELSSIGNKVGFTINLRDRLTVNPGRGCGSYASGMGFEPRFNPARGFESNLVSIHSEVKKNLENNRQALRTIIRFAAFDPTLHDAIHFHNHGMCDNPVVKKMAARMKKTYSGVAVTNLGRQSLPEKLGDLRVRKVIFLAPTADTEGIISASVLTTGGMLRAGFPYRELEFSARTMQKYVEAVKTSLTSYIG